MTTWFEKLVIKTRLPYQLFFAVVGLVLYGIGVILASLSGNLLEFVTEPKWACHIAMLAAGGAMVIYSLRRFDSSLDSLKTIVALPEEQFKELRIRLRKSITLPLYWLPVTFMVAWYLSSIFFVGEGLLDWGGWGSQWVWWAAYDSRPLFNLYYEIICLPWFVVGCIYLWVVAVGFNLAYARLCFRTPFREMPLLTLGSRLFNGFARLTIITFACLVVVSLTYLYLWKPLEPQIWSPSFSLPIGAIYTLVTALPAALLPHYFFHRLFSTTKNRVLSNIDSEIMALISKGTSTSEKKLERQMASLLQSKTAVESAKTSLLNVRIVIEFIFVSAAHLAIMEFVPYLR